VRRAILFCMLVLMLAGCGDTAAPTVPPAALTAAAPTATRVAPRPTPTPLVTIYENFEMGISARLPGRWSLDEDSSNELVKLLVSSREDGRMGFIVVGYLGEQPDTDREFDTLVQAFGGNLNPPVTYTDVQFHGYPATRIEGISSESSALGNDHRQIYHAFIADGKLKLVGVSVEVAQWEQGGRETLDEILESVIIR
jgi:hypothetical protein